MSRRIFLDVEEALAREIRRISFHDTRTKDKVILQDVYDPFTGDIIKAPLEADFYDSSADANNIQYPHIFIRLLKSREDRFTGRVVPQYGKWILSPIETSPRAYEIITGSVDALVPTPGNDIKTKLYQIRKIQPGHLIRLLDGNNKGTYKVSSITADISGNHTITVSPTIAENLPKFNYNSITGLVVFDKPIDLNTVQAGDVLIDASLNAFIISAVNSQLGEITLAPSLVINATAGSRIDRPINTLINADLDPVRFIVMDPSKPVMSSGICGWTSNPTKYEGKSPEIPLDTYYLVRIDSKTRENHIAILNRVWEEFNPPRTALPVIKRTSLSAEQLLTMDIPIGGSTIVSVSDTSNFKVNDKVFIFDDFTPTKAVSGEGFQRPFESKIINILSNTDIELEDIVPDTFKVANCAKIVSNAEFMLYMFHFVDHVTKDVEGAQYWIHEFVFWVQILVDRLETPAEYSTITDVDTPIEVLTT